MKATKASSFINPNKCFITFVTVSISFGWTLVYTILLNHLLAFFVFLAEDTLSNEIIVR